MNSLTTAIHWFNSKICTIPAVAHHYLDHHWKLNFYYTSHHYQKMSKLVNFLSHPGWQKT